MLIFNRRLTLLYLFALYITRGIYDYYSQPNERPLLKKRSKVLVQRLIARLYPSDKLELTLIQYSILIVRLVNSNRALNIEFFRFTADKVEYSDYRNSLAESSSERKDLKVLALNKAVHKLYNSDGLVYSQLPLLALIARESYYKADVAVFGVEIKEPTSPYLLLLR